MNAIITFVLLSLIHVNKINVKIIKVHFN